MYTGRLDSSESSPLENPPDSNVLAISRSGLIALTLGPQDGDVFTYDTLARVPITGGGPRPMLDDVKHADWSPDGTELAIIRNVDGSDRDSASTRAGRGALAMIVLTAGSADARLTLSTRRPISSPNTPTPKRVP